MGQNILSVTAEVQTLA